MYPIFFTIGPLTVHAYGVFAALGLFTGIRVAVYIARRQGSSSVLVEDSLYQLFWCLAISGFLGARILYVMLFWKEFSGNWVSVFKIWEGGLVFYGGLAGGVAGFFLWSFKQQQLGWRKVLDWLAPSLVLGHALGRLGCFFAGCCYGVPTDMPWAVTFTDRRCLAPLNVSLHPAQLYEFLFLSVLGGFLLKKALHNKRKDGTLFADYLAFYAVGRFLLEFLRDEPRFLFQATAGQWVSIFLFACSFGFRFFGVRRAAPIRLN